MPTHLQSGPLSQCIVSVKECRQRDLKSGQVLPPPANHPSCKFFLYLDIELLSRTQQQRPLHSSMHIGHGKVKGHMLSATEAAAAWGGNWNSLSYQITSMLAGLWQLPDHLVSKGWQYLACHLLHSLQGQEWILQGLNGIHTCRQHWVQIMLSFT